MKKVIAKKKPAADTDIIAVHNEVRGVVALIGGKWKLEILWLLNERLYRFNELRRTIPGVTQHMLTVQFRELEADGLITRTVYAEVPPRVEYQITDDARNLKPVFEAIRDWAIQRRARQ